MIAYDVEFTDQTTPGAYNAVIDTSRSPIMGLGETALVGAIVFHAFNGIRIILIDLWSKGPKYQRLMFWIVVGIWVVLMAGFVPEHLHNVFTEGS